MGVVSFLFGAGPLAAASAVVWFLFTVVLALLGLGRLREIKKITLADACFALALIYVPIGGAWLVLSRLGWQPFGFGQHTSLLTAIHFHYIPLAAMMMTGLIGQVVQATGKAFPRELYRIAALGMLINPLLVAAGITLTQLTGKDYLESFAATLLALSFILIALLNLRFIIHYHCFIARKMDCYLSRVRRSSSRCWLLVPMPWALRQGHGRSPFPK